MNIPAIETLYERAYAGPVEPYPYQRVASERDDIDVLIAPTGLGKTAAITLGWAWRRIAKPKTTPRRLVWCLPMRTLVEQTAQDAKQWMERLEKTFGENGQKHPEVHILMGGAVSDDWRLHPERHAILIGTQDMLISRALMRGYAMSRFGWPIDFGLLHTDALWVFDEVQLMGAALATSTQLEAFRRRRQKEQEPKLARSLWVSATLKPEWLETIDFKKEIPKPQVLRWNDNGTAEPRTLAERLDAVKHIRKAQTMLSKEHEKDPASYVHALAEEICTVHRPGHTTLIIVNQVRRAQALYQALRSAGMDDGRLLLLHSRFRPADRQNIEHKLRSPENPDRIIVATQAVEAGVDLTSSVLFTELAPWSSLVQRFGRCNRSGELNNDGGAEIRWIDIDLDSEPGLAKPYADSNEDEYFSLLKNARALVASLKTASPRSLPPAQDAPPLRNVLRTKDFEELFDTDPDLSGYDIDISPYIREGAEMDLRIFWRPIQNTEADGKFDQPPKTLELDFPPQRSELCSAPLSKELTSWLKGKQGNQFAPVYVETPNTRRRGGHQGWERLDKSGQRLRPGMVLLLADTMGGYDEKRGFIGKEHKGNVPFISPSLQSTKNFEAEDANGQTTGDDRLSFLSRQVLLTQHLEDVENEASHIAHELALDEHLTHVIARAGAWHDLGKAHAPFQALLGKTDDGELLAKSASSEKSRKRPENLRPYFRHELASALAFLQQHDGEPDADLIAFLIAAHHGKVRMGLRALPEEKPTRSGLRITRGVQEEDFLPAVRCGKNESSEALTLSLSLMEMGTRESGRLSWAARTQHLHATHGPFQLAYLEALVRMADWRASKQYSTIPEEAVHG